MRTTASQVQAAPITITVGEAEITWADGASATSPVNGTDSYTGTLALTNGSMPALTNRTVAITYNNGAGQADFGTQTPPSTRTGAGTATSTTGTDGKFTVSLTDPALPAGTPESGTLAATATALKGAGDAATADASDSLAVNFAVGSARQGGHGHHEGRLRCRQRRSRQAGASSRSSSRARVPTAAPGDDIDAEGLPGRSSRSTRAS